MTELSTVQERLATFKSASVAGKVVKWPHRRLSMIGMARAFFRYTPKPGAKDCVACVCCGEHFNDWTAFQGRPIYRHAESGDNCVIARLVRILIGLERDMTCPLKHVEEAFKATFEDASLVLSETVVNQLISQGFIYLPEARGNQETVGCIECNCFPQKASRGPKHGSKCHIPSLLAALHVATTKGVDVQCGSSSTRPGENMSEDISSEDHQNLSSINNTVSTTDRAKMKHGEDATRQSRANTALHTTSGDGKLRLNNDTRNGDFQNSGTLRQATESHALENIPYRDNKKRVLTVHEEDCHISQNPNQNGRESPKNSTMCAEELAVEQCNRLFSQLKLGGEIRRLQLEKEALKQSFTPEALMNHMEVLAMAMLEEAHAKRIQLVQQETERVVTNLLGSD